VRLTFLNFLFFSVYLLFFPTLPFFLEEFGGAKSEIGLLIGISSLASLAVRPFVGYAVDTLGRRPVMLAGLSVFVLNALLYNVVGHRWRSS
jgi:MFS family permease